jgi:tRNA-splicing ligase RtcB
MTAVRTSLRAGDLPEDLSRLLSAIEIVRGLGNTESFHSASHGAGRRMSRTKARKLFTAADLATQTAGVECRKDPAIIDEIPAAYKNIDDVLHHQTDLVEIVTKLKQIICVKG